MEETLKILQNGEPAEKINQIEMLINEDLEADVVKMICRLISDKDKGVRNAASLLLTLNENPLIPHYLIKEISAEEASIRNLAGEILIKNGSLAVDELMKSMETTDDDDLKFVIDILGLIGDPKPAQKIISVLNENENENVVLACIEALGNIQYEKSVKAITPHYDKNELYKPTIIEALGKIGSKEVLEFIMKKYSEEDELIKFAIIESLGLIGDESSFFFLVGQLNDIEESLVLALINSIFLLKEKYNFDVPIEDKMKNAILKTIDEGDYEYKRAAIGLVDEFEDKDILRSCLKTVGEEMMFDEIVKPHLFNKPEFVYKEIATMLSGDSVNQLGLMNLLKEMLEFSSVDVRIALSEFELRGLTDGFTKNLEHPDEEVRRTAMELLYQMDTDTWMLFIDVLIEDTNIWNRIRLLDLLEENESPDVLIALEQLSNDSEIMVSQRAQFILSQRSVNEN